MTSLVKKCGVCGKGNVQFTGYTHDKNGDAFDNYENFICDYCGDGESLFAGTTAEPKFYSGDVTADDVTPATEEAIEQEWRGYDDDGRNFHVDELPEWLRYPTDY